MKNMLDSIFFAQLFVSERKQIAMIADEKSPTRISHRSFATKSLRNEDIMSQNLINEDDLAGLLDQLNNMEDVEPELTPEEIASQKRYEEIIKKHKSDNQ